MTRVLIVDDEPHLLRALQITLKARGYEPVTASTGRQALSLTASRRPDVVILDLGLADMDGVDVVRELRSWSSVPVIVLSGRMASASKVEALDAGADDYVTKPFGVEELLARIRAAGRRAAADLPPPVRWGRWLVDVESHRVLSADGGDEEVHLTPTEWQIVTPLLANPEKLVTQRQLMLAIWGPGYGKDTGYLRQYVKNLRRKLEDDPGRPQHLVTEPGVGYRFQP